ncbi:MAG: hypothetical protein ABJ308_18290 [Halieaceae bacterium]
MTRPVDMACFSARYLALLRRFPNQVQSHSVLVLPAPDAEGVLIFAVSHNGRFLLFHDATGFSNGVYEFGLPEDFFSAIAPRHFARPRQPADTEFRLALSNGEYRLYENTPNEMVFENSQDESVVFTWAGRIAMPGEHLQDALDKVLRLHQSDSVEPLPHALAGAYASEADFICDQLAGEGTITANHVWVREKDETARVLSRYTDSTEHTEALICVAAENAIG